MGGNGVTASGLALLGCRLLSLYLLYLAIQSITFLVYGFVEGGPDFLRDLSLFLNFGLNLATCAAFWFGAPWLSRKMIPPNVEQVEAGAPGVEHLMMLAVVILGLVLLSGAIPRLASTVALGINEGYFRLEAVEVVVRIVLGAILILGSQGIARAIGRVRRW